MTAARLARTCAALAAGAALVGGAATTASAQQASTVKPFSSNVIVVQKSIGGIHIGEPAGAVRNDFPNRDCDAEHCTYDGTGYSVLVIFRAPKSGDPRVVDDITLFAKRTGTAANKLHTDKGIGIDSTAAAVLKAYPNVRGNKKTGPYFIGSGKPNTVLTFFALNDGHKVNQVNIAVQHGS